MHERNAEILYFNDVPALSDLCLVVVSVPTNCKLGSGKQPHVIRCRELIFTEPDIVATPTLGRDQSVQIIMQQSLYRTGRLQGRFQKMGLQVEKPRRVTAAIFQSCYTYTLLAKLAPGWNKMGDYLVQGLDVNVTEKEVCLAVRAHIIMSSPIQLADLGVCRPAWNKFTSQPRGKIMESSICNKWCHVLPSMKKGKIVNLLRQIPEDSPFKTYKDIKRYWKNTYGYRLPETDEGMIYYQVYFKPIGNILFTYPECCVRAKDVIVFARTDPRPILQGFFSEFHAKLPSVCGQKVQFATRAKYHTADLLNANEAEDIIQSSCVNLSDRTPTYLQQACRQRISQTQQPTRCTTGLSQLSSLTTDQTGYSGSSSGMLVSLSGQTGLNKRASDMSMSSTQPQTQPTKRVVPVFRPKIHKQQNGVVAFRPYSEVKPKTVLTFQAVKPISSVVSTIGCSQSGAPMHDSSQMDVDCIPPTQYTPTTNHLAPMPHNQSSAKKPVFLKTPNRQYSSAGSGIKPPTQNAPVFAKKLSEMAGRHTPLSNLSLSHSQPSQTSQTPVRPNMPQFATSSVKRKLDLPESDVKAKKPRAKPKVQEDVDIEALAKVNQLAKVNTVTLVTWLKDKGVSCKSKVKKGDLVEKVMHTLRLSVPEQ